MMTAAETMIATVRKSFQAYVDGDRTAIEPLISEVFRFTSPLDNHIDRHTYFERCWPNSEWITGYEFVRCFAEGDQVVVTYIGQSNHGNQFQNTEIFTLRNEKIEAVEVYFGWRVPHKAAEGGFISND